MALHEVGFEPELSLARARTAHNHDIFVSCQSGVFGPLVHGQAFCLREDDVVSKGRIDQGLDVLRSAP